MSDESTYSTFFEQMIGHVFIAELLQEAWYGFHERVEVLKAEVDSYGYDVVLECNGRLRYTQLKAGLSAGEVTVNVGLANKPGGCVVWIFREENRTTRRMKLRYLFFGGRGRKRLPSLGDMDFGRHTRGAKNERPNIRVIKKGHFVPIKDTRELVKMLFGLREAKKQT
jgi:hypothetical protein